MTETTQSAGRVRQRRRTRAAIVRAAEDLIAAGQTPTVNEVADAAEVSRRTVYQYFPTLEQLLIDATLGLLTQTEVDEAIERADVSENPSERVEAMIRALHHSTADTLPLGRSLLRLTLTASPEETAGPRRGYRRIAWIERAVEPLRPMLDEAGYQRLVSALAMVIGWEALIVLNDLRGLPPQDQVDTSTWAARALISEALRQAKPPTDEDPDGSG
ncbi:TetR/AcrR family transcriptional regulator [Microlunatus ginsengisoli]|uniref:HTH tetR-type domain-containing protein n=1 Tax=Microlunatus ginsengisoli TaxID=363863 RepID=A0ABP6ZW40_9ACTN